MKTGTLVDATVIASASEGDEDARWSGHQKRRAIHGYKAQVFEFISPEHTGKNLMISAVKQPQRKNADRLREQFRAIVAQYGIRQQRLAHLLGEL